jgi:hypothetical protein
MNWPGLSAKFRMDTTLVTGRETRGRFTMHGKNVKRGTRNCRRVLDIRSDHIAWTNQKDLQEARKSRGANTQAGEPRSQP